ncbi:MAG: M28 family peptidase [Promethearchaeota archaeon]|nr:MAG: M28 family peptidase [Candidatus Lokiarchaeota archaeon]
MMSKNNIDCHDFVKKLSFPRLAGSIGEKQAQNLIETELNSLNIHFSKEKFEYTKFFMNILLKIYNLFLGFQIIAILILLYFGYYYLASIIAVFLLLTSAFSRQIREKIQFKFTKIGKKRKSINYVINMPAKQKNKNETKNVIILAHYDSISMKFHPVFDGAIFFFGLVGGCIFAIHILLIVFFHVVKIISSIEIIQFIYGIILAIFYSLQVFNKRDNKSFGTADNATAVASAIDILDYFNENPLKCTNLFVVLTGAEEMGDYGADSFIKKHHDEFDKKNSFFLILDTVGANKETNLYAHGQGFPKSHYSPVIYHQIQELLESSKADYKIKPLYIPPLIHFSTDHAPLKQFGYEFMIFLSNARIHSDKDNIENYFPKMLDNFNTFIKDLILHMDKFPQN